LCASVFVVGFVPDMLRLASVQNRPVQNRPFITDHSKQTTFITDPFITDPFI